MVAFLVPLVIVGAALIGGLTLFGGERFIATRERTALIKAEKFDIESKDYPFGFGNIKYDLDAIEGTGDPKTGYRIDDPNFTIQTGEITPPPSGTGKIGGDPDTKGIELPSLSGLFSINTIKIIIFLALIIVVFKGVKK